MRRVRHRQAQAAAQRWPLALGPLDGERIPDQRPPDGQLETRRIKLESAAIFSQPERPETMNSYSTCRYCQKRIDNPRLFAAIVLGKRIILHQTIHDDCLAKFETEQRQRKPYRQPLEEPRRRPISELPETDRDFDEI